jgi:hypothetical protein
MDCPYAGLRKEVHSGDNLGVKIHFVDNSLHSQNSRYRSCQIAESTFNATENTKEHIDSHLFCIRLVKAIDTLPVNKLGTCSHLFPAL